MRSGSLLILFVFCLLTGAGRTQTISVAAAADLRYAMTDIVAAYAKTDSSVHISLTFGSSGNFYQQIVNRAPFDLFFSADESYPQKLADARLTTGKPMLYAQGKLVLWSRLPEVSHGIALLKSASVQKIAIANPAHAPYGKRAMECLTYYRLDSLLAEKLVRGDNVSQAAQFAVTGSAQAALIALSLALSPEMAGKGRYYSLDEKSYSPLLQAYVIPAYSPNSAAAKKFAAFIHSRTAQSILQNYGFTIPAAR